MYQKLRPFSDPYNDIAWRMQPQYVYDTCCSEEVLYEMILEWIRNFDAHARCQKKMREPVSARIQKSTFEILTTEAKKA